MDNQSSSDYKRQHARDVLTNYLPKTTRPSRQRRGGLANRNRKGINFNNLANDESGNSHPQNSTDKQTFKHSKADDFVIPGEEEFNKAYNNVRKSPSDVSAPTSLIAAFSKPKSTTDAAKETSETNVATDDVFSEPKPKYTNYGKLFGNANDDDLKTKPRRRSSNKDNAPATAITNLVDNSESIAPKGSAHKNNKIGDISPSNRSNLSTANSAINTTSSYNKTNGGENNSTGNKTQRDKLDSHDELLVENSNKYRRSAANVKLTASKGILHSREKARQVQPKRSLYLPMYIQPVKDDPPSRYPTHRVYGDYGINRNISSDMYANSSTDSLLSKSSISSQRKISTDMNKYDSSSSSSESSTDNEETNEKSRIRSFDYSGIQKPKSTSPPSSDNNNNQANFVPTRRRRRLRSRRSQNQRRIPSINKRDVSPIKQESSLSGFKPSMHNNNLFLTDKYATVPDDFVTHDYKQEVSESTSPVKATPNFTNDGNTKLSEVTQQEPQKDNQLISNPDPNVALDEVHMLHGQPTHKTFDYEVLNHGNIKIIPEVSTTCTGSINERKKVVGSIRKKFNNQTSAGDLGQSFLSGNILPDKKLNTVCTGDSFDNVVESKPLLKAKKVSEHFWPKDEATERLLNQHTSQSNSDKMQETIDQLKGLADEKAIDILEFSAANEAGDINLADPANKNNQSKSTSDLSYNEPSSIKRPGILNISKVQMVRIPTLDVSPGKIDVNIGSQRDFDKAQSTQDLTEKTKPKRKRGQSYMKTSITKSASRDELSMTLPNMRTNNIDSKLATIPKPIGLLEMKELTASLRKFKLAGPPTAIKPEKASVFSDPLMHVDNNGTIISTDLTLKIGSDYPDPDVDEGIVTEAALSPIDHDKNVAKFEAHLESGNEVKRKSSNSSARRRRKGSSNNNSDISGGSNGSDTQRCKSDPIANRNRKPEAENTALDSNLLGSLQAPKEEDHSSIMSVCTEHISDGSEYEKYEAELNAHLSKYDDADGSRKGAKKKSLSDPNPKGVISGGFNGDGDVIEEAAVCSASSEPNIAEQCDQLGDLEQFRKYRSSKGLSDSNIRNENKVASNKDTKSETDAMSPRSIRKSVSMKARKRAENGAIKLKDLVISKSQGDLNTQNNNMEIFENEENQFNALYESMRSSKEPEIEKQVPLHVRSSSEPVPMSEETLAKVVSYARQDNDTRGRRVGISHSPFDPDNREIASSANDITLRRLSDEFKHANVRTAKSMDRGFATLPRAAKPTIYLDSDGKRPDMRLLVLNNLLETEESYVNSLQILYEDYYKPLKKPENHAICEPRLVDEMFYQIPEILQHHESFSDNLRNAAHNWNIEEIKLGELFMNSFNRDMLLESYSAYITNFMSAREAVNVAMQSKAGFKSFIEQCQRENKEKQGLSDLMIKPVQRIPRYELILKDLIKHTPAGHPDRESLLIAQQEIHTLAEQMNRGEKEAEMADKHARLLQEIETLVDNCVDLCVPKRRFLRQDIAFEVKNAGTRKDRCIWLFNDLIVCTTVKKGRTGTTRRSSMGIWALGEERHSIDFSNKYKFMWKFPLEDIELVPGGIPSKQVVEKQVHDLQNDIEILQQIHKLTNDLSVNHQNLDDDLKNLIQLTNRQLSDKQHMSSMHSVGNTKVEFAISTAGEIKHIEFEFASEDNKHEFETNFTKYKSCLTHQNNLWEPVFMKALPIAKTRSGMQFSCAAPNMSNNTRVVWVCNSDGFVGQVCLLDLERGIPNQTNSIAVCTSKICCIAEIPPPGRKLVPTHEFMRELSKAPLMTANRRNSTSNNNNPAKNIIAWDDDTDEDEEDNTSTVSTSSSACHMDSPHTTNNSAIAEDDEELSTPPSLLSPLITSALISRRFGFTALDKQMAQLSSSGLGALTNDSHNTLSDTLGLQEGGAWKKHSDGSTIHGSLDDFLSEEQTQTPFVSGKSSSIWLGTEDGRIHIYPSSNTVRGGQDRIRAVHSSSVQCIVHYEGQVFVALSNGDLVCYERNINGDWDFENKVVLQLGSAQHAISKMVVVDVEAKELWCACQNQVIIVDILTKQISKTFLVSDEAKRQVHCMVSCGYGVWIALDKRPHIKLYHSITNSIITDIDVAAPVNKMLASSDAIIRQHKSACLRITALLVCKELLWVGTSAGVVLTLKLPKVRANTTSLTLPIMPLGLTYGHTGHVRFLTAIEIPEEQIQTKGSLKRSSSLNKRRSSAGSTPGSQMLIISGGDGYEDFRMNSTAESAGKEDSTNHLLMWKT